jgi:hypothetical protein
MARPFVIRKFHRYQKIVHDTHSRFKVIVAGRRWGKTEFCKIQLILAAIKKPGSLVWYVAPTYAMANDIMWGQLIASIPRSYMAKKPNDTKMTIFLKNGSVIQCKGADKPDSLRGRGVDMVVLDEYQDFKLGVWDDVIFPTLTDRRGYALIIGTPKAYNHLYKLYEKGQSKDPGDADWASWQFPTSTSPFIPVAELASARRNMDERSYKQEFEACHVAGTKIRLWNGGNKSVEDIRSGDVLIHLSDDGTQFPTTVQDAGATGLKSCCIIVLENGERFEASSMHKMKVKDDYLCSP